LNTKLQNDHPKLSLLKVFKTIIRPRIGALLIGLLLIIITRLAALVMPGASRQLIDEVIPFKNFPLLYWLLGIVLLAIVIQSICSFWLTKMLSVEAQHLIAQLRVQVQKHVLSLPISFFDNNKAGALVSRIMSDVEGVRNLVGTGLVYLIGGFFTAVFSMILLMQISVSMTLLSLIPVSIYIWVSMRTMRFLRPIFRKRRVISAEVTGRLTESLSGIRIIKGFHAEDYEQQIFENGVQRLYRNIKTTMTRSAIFETLSTFLMGLASVGVMGLGGYYMAIGDISVGEFISFTMYLGFMVNPLIQMGNIGTQLTESMAGLDKTEELMNMSPENDTRIRQVELVETEGNIVFDNVNFAYESDNEVLHDISFEAPKGSVTALVGTSGSGKSTIAGLVASFLHDYRGSITVDGIDLTTISLPYYRKHLGLVLQDDFLFEGTIRENIRFANAEASEEALLAAIAAAHVNEFTDRFEKGLDTVIGERGVKLSGGQRQRLAIARAILADPRILILDEATSNLDTESEMLIQRSLSELMKGRTTFVIAHRLSTIRRADQILVIEKGHIVERGTHTELLALEGRYFELHTYQARI
jgi:ABC-type multidrug transport system fused ATPase/permease subunit